MIGFIALMMETVCVSETLASCNDTTRRYISERISYLRDRILHFIWEGGINVFAAERTCINKVILPNTSENFSSILLRKMGQEDEI
jgi:hypothetical protein